MTWKNEIKKSPDEIEELEDYAGDVLRYIMGELRIPQSKIEAVLKTALDITEMNLGEQEEERRADRRHMSINER
tara:strand:+ start:1598 stop:1819 length:222 start_codon:yes stop_codon:yes gene_type:complete